MTRLTKDIQKLDEQLVDLWTRYGSGGEYERQIFIPMEENIQSLESKLQGFGEDLEVASPETDLDRITVLQMKNVADVLAFRLADDRAFPFRYLGGLSGSVNQLLLMDVRPMEERLGILTERLEAAGVFLEALLKRCARVTGESRDMVREYLESFKEILNGLPAQMEELEASSGELTRASETAGEHTRKALAELGELKPATDPIEPLPYAERLRRIWGIELEELLSWHEEEIEKSLQRLKDIAADIDPDRDPYEILDTDMPSCDNPEDMFPMMEKFVAHAREKSLDYITLPEGEVCEVWPVPKQLKDSYPWGGYNGPDPLLENLRGAVFLNDYNYESVTLGWMEMMAIHECYPGHHAQRVKTAASALPGSFKVSHLMNRSGPLNEGIAHRAETQFQDIFPEPAFPLFVALRRLHTAVRIKADLGLHHFGTSIDEAVELYQQYCGFSRQASRGQVRFQELWPGYMTIYYYGQKYLGEMLERLGWDDPTFTEMTFSVGYSGLDILEEVAKLDPESREAIVKL